MTMTGAVPAAAPAAASSGNPYLMAGMSAASGLFGGMWGYFSSKRENKKAREWNEKMSELTYERDLEMWNRTNAYNSPKAQMERWKEAGLNPHLIYGQGTPGNATDAPKYRPPEGKFGNLPSPNINPGEAIQAYQNAIMLKANIDRIETMNDLTKEEQRVKQIEGMAKEAQLWYDYGVQSGVYIDNYLPISTAQSEYGAPRVWYDLSNREYDLLSKKATINKTWKDIERLNKMNALTDQQTAWLTEKLKNWTEKKINIDKDNIVDRQLQEMINNLPAGKTGLRLLIDTIRAFSR